MVGMGRDMGGRKGKGMGERSMVWIVCMDGINGERGKRRGRDRQGVEGYCWGLIHYLTASTSSLFIIDIISVQIMKKK